MATEEERTPRAARDTLREAAPDETTRSEDLSESTADSTFEYLKSSRILAVAKSRFEASDRLALHQKWTQWTVAIASTGLIIVAMWTALDLPIRVLPGIADVIQVGFAVLILAYSQLLSMENFAVRSERMQKCGLELSRLADEITAHDIGADTESKGRAYKSYSRRYSDIMDHYENHSNNDFFRYKLRKWRTSKPWMDKEEYEFPGRLDYWVEKIRIYAMYTLQFSHYMLVIVAVVLSCLWIL